MGTNKNEINNNIIKLLFTVAFSVSVPERGLSYIQDFNPLTLFLTFFSSNKGIN